MADSLKNHIPNAITCCNLIWGAIASYEAFHAQYSWALTCIIAGAIFDFFDGFAARLLNVSSSIGKELDSLADDITFGLAPSAMVFSFMKQLPACQEGTYMAWLPYCAFLIAAFSALRLAKFNLDTRQTSSFIGLPTPANALFWGAFIISMGSCLQDNPLSAYILLAIILLSSWMMVAEIPMFALKFKNFSWKDNKIRFLFALSVLVIIGIGLCLNSIAGIWISMVWYIVLSIATQKKNNS